MVDVSIVNFKFSAQFTQAIENKQTAEQMALKASRDLDRIKIEAQQKIAAAQAEAESLRLQRQNITQDLVELRRIEAMQQAIQKWNGVLPQVTGGAMPFIDAKSYTGEVTRQAWATEGFAPGRQTYSVFAIRSAAARDSRTQSLRAMPR